MPCTSHTHANQGRPKNTVVFRVAIGVDKLHQGLYAPRNLFEISYLIWKAFHQGILMLSRVVATSRIFR
jgi:hypothetical protein